MAVSKLTKFLGIAPKLSPELLPNTAAQTAVNVKLYAGDLIPYRSSEDVVNVKRSGEIKTIYPMDDPDTGARTWLSWLNDVDIAVASASKTNEQRIYYTGDGVPKVTNYELAVTGSGPWPVGGYELGLPLPTTKPVATPATLSAFTIINVSRDSSNIATIETSAAHGYKTGDSVTISGFTYMDLAGTGTGSTDDVTVTSTYVVFPIGSEMSWTSKTNDIPSGFFTVSALPSGTTFEVSAASDAGVASGSGQVEVDMRGLNVRSVEITVIDSTHFSVYSVGPEMGEHSGTLAQFNTTYGDALEVILAGEEITRSYIYTWMTPWGEESIPSDPSDDAEVREGQTVTISALPTAPPAGNNFIRGFRLYRTVTDTSGSTYFRIRTVWFPVLAASASRTSNIATITMADYHNLEEEELFKIDAMEFGTGVDTSFDVTEGEVIDVIDEYTFTYASTGSDKATTATVAGTLYSDTAEYDSGNDTYYESSTFVDNYEVGGLAIELSSIDADAPDEDMTGLITAHNNILAGFVGNELCFSEPDKPWSWPLKYRLTFASDIVAIASISGAILVLTDKHPYTVYGNNPENMSTAKVDVTMPCVAKRGVVNLGYGVIYPSNGGLAVHSPSSGAELITKDVHDWDTWETAYTASTIRASFFDGKYFASHSTGSFIFERQDQVGGLLVTTPIQFYAAYYDTTGNVLYYISNLEGQLSIWDAVGQPSLSLEWKTKVFVDPGYTSIGAMRVVADYRDTAAAEGLTILAYNDATPAYNTAIWALMDQIGTINGPVDYVDPNTSNPIIVSGQINGGMLGGGSVVRNLLSLTGVSVVQVSVWANKVLKHTVNISDSEIFRLPTKYKADTFEVSVSGALRIRAIHIGETPYSLRGV